MAEAKELGDRTPVESKKVTGTEMNKSTQIKRFVLAALLLAGLSLSAQAKQPNILFFYADDWGKMASCYTDDSVFGKMNETFQTSAFDRLANEGARFRNAFYPVSQCTPCRCLLYTSPSPRDVEESRMPSSA